MMPPLTSPARPLNPVIWRLLLVVACVLVFSFALHAKVAVYEHSGPQASTSSKMWSNGARFESPVLTLAALLPWLAFLLPYILLFEASRRYHLAPVKVLRLPRQRCAHQFRRPPPAL